MNIDLEIWLAIAGLLVTLALWTLDRFWGRRNRLTWRAHIDIPVGRDTHSGGEAAVWPIPGFDVSVVDDDNRPVDRGSLVLLRIRNVGSDGIVEDEFAGPVTFRFPGRAVRGLFLVESPMELRPVLERTAMTADGDTLTIDPFPLNRRQKFKLVVILTGSGERIEASAFIKRGEFFRESSRIGTSRRSMAFGGGQPGSGRCTPRSVAERHDHTAGRMCGRRSDGHRLHRLRRRGSRGGRTIRGEVRGLPDQDR